MAWIISFGRFVHYLINFAFRSLKLWWKLKKTFMKKIHPFDVERAVRLFIGRTKINVLFPKPLKYLACSMGWCKVFLKHWLSRKVFLNKIFECFHQNLALIILLIDFHARFCKNEGSFDIFYVPSPCHEESWMSRFLMISWLWICNDKILWHNLVNLLFLI